MTSTKECPELISQLILSQLDLGATLGALYTGASLSAIVYGITCCQAFCYYRSDKAKHDSWILKAFVAFLMVLVTFQQALITETCYDYMVSHYDDPCALLKIIWPAMTSVLFESIIGGLVRCFLIRRVWLLSRNHYLTVFCSVVIAAHLALTLVLSVKGYINPDVFAELLGLQPVAIAGYSVSSLADMSISASIIFYLYRSRTGFRRSDDIISKLMLLTVSTGLLTTVVMVVGLIMCAVFPGTYYSVTIEFILTKLYINSLLTTLNLRDSIRERPIEGTTGLMNSIPLSDHPKNLPPPRVNIRIDHIVESDRTKHVALGPVESKYSLGKQNQVTGSDASDAEEVC